MSGLTEQDYADAFASLDIMVQTARDSIADRTDPLLMRHLMTASTLETYTTVETAAMLAVAVARLAAAPAVSGDVLAGDLPPVHAVASVAPGPDGVFTAVCVCSAPFVGDEDTAVQLLDAHLAEAGSRPAGDWREGDPVTVTITDVHVDGIGDHHTWLACAGLAEGIELPFVDDDGGILPNVRIVKVGAR